MSVIKKNLVEIFFISTLNNNYEQISGLIEAKVSFHHLSLAHTNKAVLNPAINRDNDWLSHG